MKTVRGSILIMALWILTILVLLSLGLGYAMSLDIRLVSYQRDQLEALYLAKAGVARAVAVLEQRQEVKPEAKLEVKPETDASPDPWFTNLEAFRDVELGHGRFTVSTPHPDGDQPDRVVYGLIDEDRKINLNTAAKDILMRLPGMTQEAAESIIDWRDTDPFPSGLVGAEDFYYRGLEPPYSAKNAPFDLVEEVSLVRGVTEKVFDAIRACVTIYTDGKVNLNTAPVPVLVALGMSEGLARKIVQFRSGPDGLVATADDQRFETLGSAQQRLNAETSLTPQEGADLTNAITRGLLKLTSEVFTVASRGTVREGKIARRVEAVVKRIRVPKTGRPLTTPPTRTTIVLSWRET